MGRGCIVIVIRGRMGGGVLGIKLEGGGLVGGRGKKKQGGGGFGLGMGWRVGMGAGGGLRIYLGNHAR